MQYTHFRRPLAGLAAGLTLFCGVPAYGQDYYGRDADPYEQREQPYRSNDRYNSAPPAQAPYSSRSPNEYGVPFGASKSTAGAVAGALLGAGSGAIIGSKTGSWGKGAAIGAGIGGLGGYAIGRQLDGRDQNLDAQDQLLEQQRGEIARNRALIEDLKRRKLDVRETPRGVVVNLPDVLFQFNSAQLTREAQSKVSQIASVVSQRARGRRIAVEGHADAVGSESYNAALSKRRAASVARELSYDGVGGQRLATRGYGEKYPVAPNSHSDGSDNPAGRAKNRRVEVVIEN